MKCLKCVNRVKAEWRSSMKIYFHGFGGLGGCKTSGGRLFCTDRSGTETYTNKRKMHFARTNALLAN